MLRVAVLLLSLFFLYVGANEVYEGWKNPKPTQPTRTTVAEYTKSDKSKKWVVLTDAKINLLKAVTVTTTTTTTNKKTHELVSSKTALSELYIPIESAGSTQNDTVSLLLKTDNAEILNVARQMDAMSGEKFEAKLLEFLVRERDKLIRSVELSGLMEKGGNVEIRKHFKNLADDFYILKHNQSVSEPDLRTVGSITMGVGLLLLITGFIFSPRRKKDDSQVQPATLPMPQSLSIPLPPKMGDVVLKQKLVPPPDGRKEKMPRDYHKILEISHSADLEEIKQAAQIKGNDIKTALSLRYLSHADAQARLNEIEEAFEALSKPETRAAYGSLTDAEPSRAAEPGTTHNCESCGSTILFGGKKLGIYHFCNDKCQENFVDQLSKQAVDEVFDGYAHQIHQGSCPQCHGPGPVDVHTSYWVWSLVFFTRWNSRSQLCCRSCGTKRKIEDALFSLVCGWWGVPFGLIITPFQIIRNVVGLFTSPDPLQPSLQLKTMIKQHLAGQ